ncbi:pyrroline-5-carboxylate reductase [Vibrio viridaestus]|uniref:Pyrroline-5-carboxylate reductase n=1 Tax=Vibrio viridaestus TaxID=2487322 RepID=A0A3N9TF48_9VIBR|nr:pyrroline-5-carboxylate reductase [Vibrio viridaestus]RQW62857.1 pyrroline-5-carboxylate reductase [Vibrio viridaestus]
MEQKTIAFIGAGNMAEAIFSGMVKSGYDKGAIIAANRGLERLEYLKSKYDIQITQDNINAAKQADVVVLSVKPQIMADVCTLLSEVDFSDKLVVSIAAGVTCDRIASLLKADSGIVRVMPNTPSLLGKGMSGLYANSATTTKDKEYAEQLLKSVGDICWTEDESGINSVTGISGSGPAYFFLFMEAMQLEALNQGFDEKTARTLVQQTALGAAEMVVNNPDLDIGTLRERVTSKGGTTAAALATFNEHSLKEIVSKSIQSAVARAEEMEKLF